MWSIYWCYAPSLSTDFCGLFFSIILSQYLMILFNLLKIFIIFHNNICYILIFFITKPTSTYCDDDILFLMFMTSRTMVVALLHTSKQSKLFESPINVFSIKKCVH